MASVKKMARVVILNRLGLGGQLSGLSVFDDVAGLKDADLTTEFNAIKADVLTRHSQSKAEMTNIEGGLA